MPQFPRAALRKVMSSHIIVALDLGTRYTGVAVADAFGNTPVPLGTIECNGSYVVESPTLNYLTNSMIGRIVVGKTRAPGLLKMRSTILGNILKGPGAEVIEVDESFSSALAEHIAFSKLDTHCRAAYVILCLHLGKNLLLRADAIK